MLRKGSRDGGGSGENVYETQSPTSQLQPWESIGSLKTRKETNGITSIPSEQYETKLNPSTYHNIPLSYAPIDPPEFDTPHSSPTLHRKLGLRDNSDNDSITIPGHVERLPTPPPHIPLRKESSKRLRLNNVPPSSPLNENSRPRAEQSPRPSIQHNHSQHHSPSPRQDTDLSYSPHPSPVGLRSHKERSISPSPSRRHRGLTAASDAPSPRILPVRPLRTTTSIPSLVSYGNMSPVGGSYRSQSVRDSYQASLRREPGPRRDGHFEEVRTSYRSAFTTTTASSAYLDGTNTERSSIATKATSTSDFVTATPIYSEAEDDSMSLDDVLGMYEDGFVDEEVVRHSDMTVDEGYASQSTQSTKEELPCRPLTRRYSASILETRLSSYNNPPEVPPKLPPKPGLIKAEPVVRSSTQIMAGRGMTPDASLPIPRDRYGFKKRSQNITVEEYDKWNGPYTEYLERRKVKWVALMKQYGLSTENPIRFPPKSDKVKRFIRKGVPPEWRGNAWFWYAGGPALLARHHGLYWDLIERVHNGEVSDTDRDAIERDLNRTFPDNIKFKPDLPMSSRQSSGFPADLKADSETPILRALRRVLQAFAIHNPHIGYCQSLNFLAGFLLLFLDEDEEKAFIMLNKMTNIYLPGTHGRVLEANIDIGVLMSCVRESMPAIWAKIDDTEDIAASTGSSRSSGPARLPTVSLSTTAWFMSCFLGSLPIETVVRVWDTLFYEGSRTLFRIALAIFKLGEPEIRAVHDNSEVFQIVQTIPRKLIDANILMQTCFRRRNGFGHISQETIEAKRAQRRKMFAEDANKTVAKHSPKRSRDARTVDVQKDPAPKSRFKRSISRKRGKLV